MTVKDAEGSGPTLVPGVHRVIRAIDAGEGPFAGSLVTVGDSVAVLVDAAQLSGWAGWRHAGAEHVAAPSDVARRADGQDVLLPWCTERIEVFLGRRVLAGMPLAAGEVTTLVASLLRGLDELGDAEAGASSGGWWLTDDGRPVFAIGAGEDSRAGAVRIVEGLRREQPDRSLARLLSAVHDGLLEGSSRPRIPRLQLERWESELFETAAPRPLRQDVHAPELVRDLEVTRAAAGLPSAVSRRDARAAALGSAAEGRGARLRGRAVRLAPVLTGFASRLVERVGVLRARSTSAERDGATLRRPEPDAGRRPRRRGKVAIAGAAAAAVLTGGLLWPGGATGDPEPPTEASDSPASASTEAPSDDRVAEPSEEPEAAVDDADPVAAASALLAIIAACAEQGDQVCGEAVLSGATGIVHALGDVARPDGPEPALALVDEYGDVAVIRLSRGAGAGSGEAESAQPAEQMIVVVRQNEKWLVRDVYGVADQPG